MGNLAYICLHMWNPFCYCGYIKDINARHPANHFPQINHTLFYNDDDESTESISEHVMATK